MEGFVRETGEPARERVLPPAGVQPDLKLLLELSGKYGLEII